MSHSQSQPPSVIHMTQKQFDILLPLVSFNLQILDHLQKFYPQTNLLKPHESARIVQQCTQMVDRTAFLNYFSFLQIKVNIDALLQSYSFLHHNNFEQYLDDIYLFASSPALRNLLYQWSQFVKLSFDFIEDESESQSMPSQSLPQSGKLS